MTTTNNNDDIKQNILNKLYKIESMLFCSGIEDEFEGLSLVKFMGMRTQFMVYVDRFERIVFQELVNRLEANNPAFEEGITNLDSRLRDIQNTVAFLNFFGRVLTVFGRVLGIVL